MRENEAKTLIEEAKARVVDSCEARKRQRCMYVCKARSRVYCSLISNNPTSKSKALRRDVTCTAISHLEGGTTAAD
jgi:hypothetical protein